MRRGLKKRSPYQNSFRAPAVHAAIKGTFADERSFQARIAVLPKAFGRDGRRKLVMQFHDRTAEYATDVMRTDFVTYASLELRTPLESVPGQVETSRSGCQDDP